MSRGTAKRPSTLEDHETLANKFNKYFTSVELTAYKANLITREYGLDEECGSRGESIDTGLHVETEAFEFQDVKETDVKFVIKSLAANKAPGYDKISARVLKDSCESIAPVISRLVNNSFSKAAAFPKAWKVAEVISVPKEGNSEEPANNWLISLLPILSKVSERLAHKQFVEFLTTHDKLSTYQSGNRKMHSTETALINVTDNILKAIDEKSASLLVLLDMSKAFDSLNHNLLLGKLRKLGLKASVIS